jgi:hypothetical protein
MEETCSSETSVYNKPTRSHILEDGILHSHLHENLKSYTDIQCQNAEVKLSLCLTKHYAMKTWGSGCIAPKLRGLSPLGEVTANSCA